MQLPTIRCGVRRYYADARLKQLRNVENPHDYRDLPGDVFQRYVEAKSRQAAAGLSDEDVHLIATTENAHDVGR